MRLWSLERQDKKNGTKNTSEGTSRISEIIFFVFKIDLAIIVL